MQFKIVCYHLWEEGSKFLSFTAGTNKVCNCDQFYDDLLRSSAFKTWNSYGLRLSSLGYKFSTGKAWFHGQIVRSMWVILERTIILNYKHSSISLFLLFIFFLFKNKTSDILAEKLEKETHSHKWENVSYWQMVKLKWGKCEVGFAF